MKRSFIEIDEKKCNGCGNCVVACAEGALQIIDGKAKVINESFCDGLGACIGECPMNALRIVQKDVAAFNEKAVKENSKNMCPGMVMQDFRKDRHKDENFIKTQNVPSQLTQWPVQLHLVNPNAPYFKDCNLLIAATCTAFSFGDFHDVFLKNHSLVIACPKLDRTECYVDKLSDIIRENNILSITVVRMEVPCCMGLTMMLKEAIRLSGKEIQFFEKIIPINGEVLK